LTYETMSNLWYIQGGGNKKAEVVCEETRVRQFQNVTRAKQILKLWLQRQARIKTQQARNELGYNKNNQHPDFD